MILSKCECTCTAAILFKQTWLDYFRDLCSSASSRWERSCLTSHVRTSITVEIVSPGPSRATIEARPERAADRAPAHGRTPLPPRGPVGCCRRGTRRPRRLIGKCRAGAAAGNVSAEGEAIRSNDYRKDTTVKAPSTRPAAVLGLDVGKSSHWACLIDRDGEVLASVSVNLFFTSFAKQARRSRKGGFTGCANVFSPIPVTA